MDLSAINWLAVFISALAFFGLGAIWYGPLFGRAWQRGVGLSDEEVKGQMSKVFASAMVMALVISTGMAVFLRSEWAPTETDAMAGATMGIMLGIFFILPSTAMSYIFARRPISLILIDAFYHMLAYALTGTILASWQ
ncbi:MAG: DUF1761 domain-containing protein [Roseivirga sp.]|nr:DUF1761 domain-containing protein [Roseivirga sp.]